MAIRVLGYKSVVEAKGTWPTNYIAKAQELKVLKDVKYGSYTDGAERGKVSLLIWNMLRTKVWDVNSESEKDGLSYSQSNNTMINKYFEDYTYTKADFDDYVIDKDGKVIITLNQKDYEAEEQLKQTSSEYEYAGNDFYTFVKGTEVEVLVNEEDETLLMMVPAGNDKLVDGAKETLDEDYKALRGEEYDYAYTIIEKKDISSATKLKIDSNYIYEVKSQSSSVRLNKKTYSDDDYEDAVVIIDGERASLKDVKEGMTLSEVYVDGEKDNTTFYVASSEKVDGKFTKYVENNYKATEDGTYRSLTIGGKEYTEYNATYVEDPDDSKEKQTKLLNTKASKDMKNEKVVAYLDFIGRVVRVEFDGKIGDESTSDVKFFAATSEVNRGDKKGIYVIELEDENGSKDEYTFVKNSQTAISLYDDNNNYLEGSFVAVTFNDDGEITGLVKIARATSTSTPEVATDGTEFEYGDDSDEKYVLVDLGDEAEYDDDDGRVKGNGSAFVVDNDTIVATVTFDEGSSETKTSDDIYEVTFDEGIEAIEKISKERILVIYDAAKKVKYAKYVVRFDDTINRDDTITGKVKDVEDNRLAGEYTVTIGNTEYTFRTEDNTAFDIEDYIDGVIVFTLKENKDGEEFMQVISGLTVDEVKALIKNDNADDYVEEVVGNTVSFQVLGDTVVTAKSFQNTYEDYLFVNVDVSDEEKIDNDEVITTVDNAIKGEKLSADDFAIGDRIIIDSSNDVWYIISGMDDREDVDTDNNEDDIVTITFVSGDETIEKEFTKGADITTDITPVKEATVSRTYTFKGWATTENATETEELGKAEEATTYYPVFEETEKTKYTITFKNNDGTQELKSEDFYEGQQIAFNGTNSVVESSTFAGWATEANATTATVTDLPNATEAVTYYEVFTANAQ